MTLDIVVVAATLATLVILLHPAFRRSEGWRATVTPLASIIGSGFLVIAPLLAFTAGYYAVFAIAALVGLAYLVGGALRYNILHVETILEADETATTTGASMRMLERVSKVLLAGAFVIAVAFYLELLGAFLLRGLGASDEIGQKVLASAFAAAIGIYGIWRGLGSLERLEQVSVNLLLAIIAGFVVALLWQNAALLEAGAWTLPATPPAGEAATVYKLMGAFLIVQGFETSRYMGDAHPPEVRVRSMRRAQMIVAVIYVLFIAAVTVFFDVFDTISETGIIDLAGGLSVLLSVLLIAGAVLSQFSSAVADVLGTGGLLREASGNRLRARWTYPCVAALAIALLWSADIFDIIAYASRAFALYYGVQCVIAALCAWSSRRTRRGGVRRAGFFLALALAMFATAALGIPATRQSA